VTIAVTFMGSLELEACNLLGVLECSMPSCLTETSAVLAGKYGCAHTHLNYYWPHLAFEVGPVLA
jgi:hypothetical protein